MQAPIFDGLQALDFVLSEFAKIMKHKVVYSEVRNQCDFEFLTEQ